MIKEFMAGVGERKFCSLLVNAFRQAGAFAYKIPDTKGVSFTPTKPFDILCQWEKRGFAIEAKYLPHMQAFGLRHFREAQIKGLNDWQKGGGYSYAVLFVRTIRGEYRAYWWPWCELRDYFSSHNGSMTKNDLEKMTYVKQCATIPNIELVLSILGHAKKDTY